MAWFLAVLWLALLLPGLSARYSFGWDSSQFDRGVFDFDILRHQPHPPGYPLWILALRGLTPMLGNPNRAQVLLALLFTIAALLFFRALAVDLLGTAAGWSAAWLLAFSPVVCLNAASSQIYAVDLFQACCAGWLAARIGMGRLRLAVPGLALAAIAGGFRPSGAVFLAPLLLYALWRGGRQKPLPAVAGIVAAAVCWLAWLLPTARLTGGLRVLSALNHQQMAVSFQKTSVFYGASPMRHVHMLLDVCITLGVALCAFVPAVLAWGAFRTRDATSRPSPHSAWATPAFFFLWMAPNLALVFLFHFSQPGYLALSLPPLALPLAWFARRPLTRLRWTGAGVAVALLVSYFPYDLFIRPGPTRLPFLLLRATPRITRLIENSQREIARLVDSMDGPPEEKLIYCLRDTFEAPNIRTVTYDFPDVVWAMPQGSGWLVFPPHGAATLDRPPSTIRSIAWLCDQAGPPPRIRAQYPNARRLAGNALYSFWESPSRIRP
ncbi:MAG TPA: hypothetical protein VMI94_12355 [Bryobacteraceae bacterium]|nr:hypothetical protein [Bryobacteraceae bacterium]